MKKLLVFFLLFANHVYSAVINMGPNGCTLQDAIRSANNDSSVGNCSSGSGTDTIIAPDGWSITLSSRLPTITTDMTIRSETLADLLYISGDNLIVTVHKVGYRLDLSEKQGLQPEVADTSVKPNKNKFYWLSFIVLGVIGSLIYFLMTYPNNENDNKTNTSNNSVQSEIPVQQTQGNSTQLFILRHTEKQSIETEDPELSSEGVERAKYWKKVLQHISFDAIYTTDFIRNVQTAKLIAGDKNAKLEIYYPMSFEVVRFLEKVKGQKILIIGHSNTIPDMVNRLIGENSYPPMSHRNYNQMYIVTIDSSGEPSSILLHIEKP